MDKIRPARLEDLPRLGMMGASFFDAAGLDRWYRYKPRAVAKVLADFMASDQAVLLVAEGQTGPVGVAGAMAYRCWFDDEHLTAQELFWWVEPSYRGGSIGADLYRGLEDWARELGCQTMEMSALDTLKPGALSVFYRRKGYGAKERIYCKRLT